MALPNMKQIHGIWFWDENVGHIYMTNQHLIEQWKKLSGPERMDVCKDWTIYNEDEIPSKNVGEPLKRDMFKYYESTKTWMYEDSGYGVSYIICKGDANVI